MPKKVPLLLWIGEHAETGLCQVLLRGSGGASRSLNPNLIVTVIQKFRKNLNEEVLFEVFSRNEMMRGCLSGRRRAGNVDAAGQSAAEGTWKDLELMREDRRNQHKDISQHTINEMQPAANWPRTGDQADRYAKEYCVSEERKGTAKLVSLMRASKWENVEEHIEKNLKKCKFQAIILADQFKRLKQNHRA
ncbi:unnamed protein product [Arctogadus glacialis]